jgi:hypothetical protein
MSMSSLLRIKLFLSSLKRSKTNKFDSKISFKMDLYKEVNFSISFKSEFYPFFSSFSNTSYVH